MTFQSTLLNYLIEIAESEIPYSEELRRREEEEAKRRFLQTTSNMQLSDEEPSSEHYSPYDVKYSVEADNESGEQKVYANWRGADVKANPFKVPAEDLEHLHGYENQEDLNNLSLASQEAMHPGGYTYPEEEGFVDANTRKIEAAENEEALLGFVDKFQNNILNDDGSLWNTGLRLIDHPEKEEVAPGFGLQQEFQANAGKGNLKTFTKSIASTLRRDGLDLDKVVEIFDTKIFKSFSLFNKAETDPTNFNSADFNELNNLVSVDGKGKLFIETGPGLPVVTLHSKALNDAITSKFTSEDSPNWDEVAPSYYKGKVNLILPDTNIINQLDYLRGDAYNKVVGETSELLKGAASLVHTNPTSARRLILEAVQNAASTVDNIQQLVDDLTQGGEIDIKDASKNLKDYALFDLITEMDEEEDGWNFTGSPPEDLATLQDAASIIKGIVFHTRETLELTSKSPLAPYILDYERIGHLTMNDPNLNADAKYFLDGEEGKQEARSLYLADVTDTDFLVSQKQTGLSAKGGAASTAVGSKAQINFGNRDFLHMFHPDKKGNETFEEQEKYILDRYQKQNGVSLNPNIVEGIKKARLSVNQMDSNLKPLFKDREYFDKIKNILIEKFRMLDSSMLPKNSRVKDTNTFEERKSKRVRQLLALDHKQDTDKLALYNQFMSFYVTGFSRSRNNISYADTSNQQRFVGISALMSVSMEINDKMSDLGIEISSNADKRIYFTSQSKLMDSLISAVIQSPRLVQRTGIDTWTIKNPNNNRQNAVTFNMDPMTGEVHAKLSHPYMRENSNTLHK
ncbi:hypothetical protein HOE37_06445 [Candidatus Woesearchaeota archaeon]|jgi:hypothetical protein|nr:hypothetical protein [Candidatus Woesearchaeota archaeon]